MTPPRSRCALRTTTMRSLPLCVSQTWQPSGWRSWPRERSSEGSGHGWRGSGPQGPKRGGRGPRGGWRVSILHVARHGVGRFCREKDNWASGAFPSGREPRESDHRGRSLVVVGEMELFREAMRAAGKSEAQCGSLTIAELRAATGWIVRATCSFRPCFGMGSWEHAVAL